MINLYFSSINHQLLSISLIRRDEQRDERENCHFPQNTSASCCRLALDEGIRGGEKVHWVPYGNVRFILQTFGPIIPTWSSPRTS